MGVVSKALEFFIGVFLFHIPVSFIRAISLCQFKVSCFVDFMFFGSVIFRQEDFFVCVSNQALCVSQMLGIV